MRPLTVEDAPRVRELMVEAFTDLARRRDQEPHPPPAPAAALVRLRHIARTDPEGCWATEDEHGLTGVALATLREGVWGLSLLIVAPRAQSAGIGRALLERALAYGAPHRAGLILSSDDPRAIRSYARAGFALVPAVRAHGIPRETGSAPGVRLGGPGDAEATAEIDRATRGGARPQDVRALLEAGATLLLHPGRGYAVVADGILRTLSALDAEAAGDLLRAAIATAPRGEPALVEFISAGQDWAIEVALAAGLDVEPYGPLFVRGEPGDLRHYLPSGAYL